MRRAWAGIENGDVIMAVRFPLLLLCGNSGISEATGENPLAMPDLLQILTVYVRIVIGSAWQPMLRCTLIDQIHYFGRLLHCYCSPGRDVQLGCKNE
ncbi:hypothetical protein D3C71_1628500 [compost metagenome]